MAHPQIAAFARMATENSKPTRQLAGQATKLSRTMHDIRYDSLHDEIVVTNPFARAILAFRGGATGEEAPIRIIQGPKTQLRNPGRVDVDPEHNEIFIPNGSSILAFSRQAKGDVAPLRIIRGPDTMLRNAGAIAVDPVRNLVVAMTGARGEAGGDPGGALVIFNRTDDGNVKPRAVIQGTKTGIVSTQQITAYPPKGWILVPTSGVETGSSVAEPPGIFVGIWSIHDNGDVPPRWKIAGPKSTLKRPRGIALNPKHKEIMIVDMRANGVLTYYFPEIF